jgi:hypothetical protein
MSEWHTLTTCFNSLRTLPTSILTKHTNPACAAPLSELNDFFDRRPLEGPERTGKYHLYNVAETFSQAQQDRNDADYNLLRDWQPTQVSLLLEGIADAFKSWNAIRHDPLGRDYLISMLPSRERKQNEKPRSKPRPTLTDTPKS